MQPYQLKFERWRAAEVEADAATRDLCRGAQTDHDLRELIQKWRIARELASTLFAQAMQETEWRVQELRCSRTVRVQRHGEVPGPDQSTAAGG
jgi:hypothetical protein